MIRHLLRVSLAGAALLLAVHPAYSQDEVHQTALDRHLQRMDFAINGLGQFTTQVQGMNFNGVVPTQTPTIVTEKPGNTAGALITLRYTKSRWVGFEANYGYARYREAFASSAFTSLPVPITPQVNANEYSFGWVVHPGTVFGVQTFVSAGSGTIAFRPTKGGGEGLPEQGRQVYYWDGGAELPLFQSHFGLRLQFRQQLFLAPDFEENYLRIKKRALTTQPGFGFYVHF